MAELSWQTPGVLSFKRQLYVCGSVPLNQLLYTLLNKNGAKMEVRHRAEAKWHPIFGYPGLLLEIQSTILASFCAYYMGRRRCLITSNLIVLVGLLVQVCQVNSMYDFVGFVIVKIGSSGVILVGQVYLTEVSDVKLRAFIFGTHNVILRLSQLLTYSLSGKSPLLIIIPLISIIASIVLSFMVPETPYWLAINGETEVAEGVLEWLRGGQLDEAEADEFFENAEVEVKRRQAGIVANMWSSEIGWRVIILLFMQLANFRADSLVNLEQFKWDREARQYFYGKTKTSSYKFHALLLYTNRIAGACLFCVSSFLLDRRILYFGTVILSFSLTLCQYLDSFSILLAVYMHSFIYFSDNVGAIPIQPIIATEIFSAVTRSFGVAIHRVLNMLINLLEYYSTQSPTIDEWYMRAVFSIRLSLFPVGVVFLFFYMPETRNLSLGQAEIAAGNIPVIFESNVLGKSPK